jgi:hypothetical protein
MLAGAPTIDGQHDAVREAQVVAVILPPGDGPFETYIEDALQAARYGAVVVPIPADADARATSGPFAEALARIRAAAASAAPPTERSPYAPIAPRPRRARTLWAVALPVAFAAIVATGILALWAAASPTAILRLAKRLEAPKIVNIAHVRGPEVALTGSRSEDGWTLSFHTHEPVKRFEYRLPSMSQFEDTGTEDALRDKETLEPMARTWIFAGPIERPTIIEVRFVDHDGAAHGPFKLHFDPLAEDIRSTRSFFSGRATRWVLVNNDGAENGKAKTYVWFSMLLLHKSAIRSIHYDFDAPTASTRFDFDPKKEWARDHVFVEAPRGARSITVDVELKDGSHMKNKFPVDGAGRG